MTIMATRPKSHRHSQPSGPVQQPEPALFNATVDVSPSEKLRQQCGGCRLSFSWFRTAKKVDDADKKHMAQAANTTEAGFSASKRLMDSKHPAIKKANELRNRIQGYWTSLTLPLTGSGADEEGRLESGTRLIRKEDVAEFHQRMLAFQGEAAAVEAEVNANLPDIKQMDRQRLGNLFREADYPDEVKLRFTWGFPNVEVPSYLEQLAPAVYEAERRKAAERFEQTYETATLTFLEEFQAVVESWVDRLGPVTRIYPQPGSPFAAYHGYELLAKVGHAQDPEVPEGQVRLRLKPEKGPEIVLGPISAADYDLLHPSEIANERRVFRDTTIENLTDLISKFRRLGTSISASSGFEAVVREMEEHLAVCRTAGETAKELRNSQTFRARTHQLMQQAGTKLEAAVTEFRQARRSVVRGILSK